MECVCCMVMQIVCLYAKVKVGESVNKECQLNYVVEEVRQRKRMAHVHRSQSLKNDKEMSMVKEPPR